MIATTAGHSTGPFCAALLFGLWALAVQGAPSDTCETGAFALRADYPGARASTCRVLGPRRLEVGIQPEDDGPINPSPWYGFHVRSRSDDAGELEIWLRYGQHKHRYAPKISADGVTWRALPESGVERPDDGGALLRLRPDQRGLYVSAQENLEGAFYAQWREKIQRRASGARWTEIGRSVGERPIHALMTNPDAANYLLLIGRQHPPEVTGALALTGFVEELLKMGAASCPARPARCRFFQTHGLVVVPLLNPDGVARGHWRHNLRGMDLNRDWGPFTQPETRAVKYLVDGFEQAGRRLIMALDFHSTYRNVFYTQNHAAPTTPPGLVARWLAEARVRGGLYEFAHEPRGLDGSKGNAGGSERQGAEIAVLPTSKNYFYSRFGVPSITYEVADEEDRGAVARSSALFAQALVDALAEDAPDSRIGPAETGW